MPHPQLAQSLSAQLQIPLPQNISEIELSEKISAHINHLIKHDFEKLITILYKADVSETRLKELLQKNTNEDAAAIITKLILAREREKAASRKHFYPKEDGSNEERW